MDRVILLACRGASHPRHHSRLAGWRVQIRVLYYTRAVVGGGTGTTQTTATTATSTTAASPSQIRVAGKSGTCRCYCYCCRSASFVETKSSKVE